MVQRSFVLDTSGILSLFLVYDILKGNFRKKYLKTLTGFELVVPKGVESELIAIKSRKYPLSKTANLALKFLSVKENPMNHEQLRTFSQSIGVSLKRKIKKQELQALKMSLNLDIPLVIDEFGAFQHFKNQFPEHKIFLSMLMFSKILLDVCLMHIETQDLILDDFIPKRWVRGLKEYRIEVVHGVLDQMHLMEK